ncbi:MAG: hypothetical protein ACOX8S_02210 [Christensenellales bacterium]|jgi:hypothetical protein
MTRRITAILLSLLMIAALLAACNGGSSKATASPAPDTSPAATAPQNINVTITNSSSYIFNELYATPTSMNEWGTDHLGSTSILKKNGSFDIKLKKYDFTNYDIKIVDEDEDVYFFQYVSLIEGSKVDISFGDGLIATVTGPDGTSSTVSGNLQLSSGDVGGVSEPGGQDEPQEYDYTQDPFSFQIYNESDYDIYAIYMAPDGSESETVDILAEVLKSKGSTTVEGSVAGTQFQGATTWTLYVEDVDGDTSVSMSYFDPWMVIYIDITWDSSSGGYVCEFFY